MSENIENTLSLFEILSQEFGLCLIAANQKPMTL